MTLIKTDSLIKDRVDCISVSVRGSGVPNALCSASVSVMDRDGKWSCGGQVSAGTCSRMRCPGKVELMNKNIFN